MIAYSGAFFTGRNICLRDDCAEGLRLINSLRLRYHFMLSGPFSRDLDPKINVGTGVVHVRILRVVACAFNAD